VIGQTLAMEGVFSFFLESSFLGLFLDGEKRLGPKLHLVSAVLVFLGSWLSGFFIIATDAWMQHPVGYTAGPKWRPSVGQLYSTVLESLDCLAIPPQYDRFCCHRQFRDGRLGSVLMGTLWFCLATMAITG
jgi:cytochrome bd-type quinol oxidase subunit 1